MDFTGLNVVGAEFIMGARFSLMYTVHLRNAACALMHWDLMSTHVYTLYHVTTADLDVSEMSARIVVLMCFDNVFYKSLVFHS